MHSGAYQVKQDQVFVMYQLCGKNQICLRQLFMGLTTISRCHLSCNIQGIYMVTAWKHIWRLGFGRERHACYRKDKSSFVPASREGLPNSRPGGHTCPSEQVLWASMAFLPSAHRGRCSSLATGAPVLGMGKGHFSNRILVLCMCVLGDRYVILTLLHFEERAIKPLLLLPKTGVKVYKEIGAMCCLRLLPRLP